MGHRAFSLIEALVSLFLMSIVLIVLADLAREYRRASLGADDQQLSVRAVTCLQDLASELRQAYEVQTPTAGGLVFTKIRADYAYLPLPVPLTWDPVPPDVGLETVIITLTEGELRRADQPLLESVQRFTALREAGGQVLLGLRLEDGQELSCRTLVYRAADL